MLIMVRPLYFESKQDVSHKSEVWKWNFNGTPRKTTQSFDSLFWFFDVNGVQINAVRPHGTAHRASVMDHLMKLMTPVILLDYHCILLILITIITTAVITNAVWAGCKKLACLFALWDLISYHLRSIFETFRLQGRVWSTPLPISWINQKADIFPGKDTHFWSMNIYTFANMSEQCWIDWRKLELGQSLHAAIILQEIIPFKKYNLQNVKSVHAAAVLAKWQVSIDSAEIYGFVSIGFPIHVLQDMRLPIPVYWHCLRLGLPKCWSRVPPLFALD
jgi:hypothetical protein